MFIKCTAMSNQLKAEELLLKDFQAPGEQKNPGAWPFLAA
jgi:hypothetical protein